MNQCTNQNKKISKDIKTDNFCYRKVEEITKLGAKVKSLIMLLQQWKDEQLDISPKIILYFERTNIIFVQCMYHQNNHLIETYL